MFCSKMVYKSCGPKIVWSKKFLDHKKFGFRNFLNLLNLTSKSFFKWCHKRCQVQKNLDLNKFWIQKIRGPKKCWVWKNVGSKKIWVPKNFCPKIFWVWKKILSKKILGPKTNERMNRAIYWGSMVPKRWFKKYFWVQNFFGSD